MYMEIFKNHKATIVKKYLKKFLSKTFIKQKLTYKTLIIRIQKYYKQRFRFRK